MKNLLSQKNLLTIFSVMIALLLISIFFVRPKHPITWLYSTNKTPDNIYYNYIKINPKDNFSIIKYDQLFNINKVVNDNKNSDSIIIFNGTQFENNKNNLKTYECQGIVINNSKILNNYYETRYKYKSFFGISKEYKPVLVVDNETQRKPDDFLFGLGGLVPVNLSTTSSKYESELRHNNMSGVIDRNNTFLTAIMVVNDKDVFIVHIMNPHILIAKDIMADIVRENYGSESLANSKAAIVDAGASTGFYFRYKNKEIANIDYTGKTKSNNFVIIKP